MNETDVKDKANKLLTQLTELIPDLHIQILASWNEDGHTKAISFGNGNWYARQGLAHEFINKDIAQENAQQLSDLINQKYL